MVRSRTDSGQTLVEVLIAVAIVTLVLVTSIAGLTLVTRNRRYSSQEALATKYNQEALEWLRRQRDSYGWRAFFELLSAASGGSQYVTLCLPSSLTSSVTLENICSVGQCYGTESSCSDNFTLQNQTSTRKMNVDLLNLSQADAVEVSAVISWADGGKTHSSEATLRLREWQ